jgi:hypothetical protein
VEDARELLNNLDSLVTPTGDMEKYGQEVTAAYAMFSSDLKHLKSS